MVDDILEALRFRRNGVYDFDRIAVVGVLFGSFILWRLLGTGSHGAPEVMRIIEQDIVEEFRQDQRAQSDPDTFKPEVYEALDVQFANVSMSAPLTSWEINEDVVVRFDYTLRMSGQTQRRQEGRYVLVTRKGQGLVYESGPLRYYAHLLL